jgi:hypothetical protein
MLDDCNPIEAGELRWMVGGEALIRALPDGTVYVRGEKVDDNKAIYQALKDWIDQCRSTMFAEELRTRLNSLIASHPYIARDVMMALEARIACSEQTEAHRALVTGKAQQLPGSKPYPVLGGLGVLNALIGPLSESSLALVKTEGGDMDRFSTFGEMMAQKPTDAPPEGHWRCDICWKNVPETKAHRDTHPFSCQPAFGLG